jgi:hypothetical protein
VTPQTPQESVKQRLEQFPLLDAIMGRRSRRFGKGMKLTGKPLTYTSTQQPQPLTIEEEAALVFAACGITGHLLAELPYQSVEKANEGGGNIMVQFVGRTVATGDGVQSVLMFVVNDEGVWLIKRPQDYPQAMIPELIQAAQRHELVELYEKGRVKIADHRVDVPHELPFVPLFNTWSANVPGTSYFLPMNELTTLYINVCLTAFSEEFGYFTVDERNNFQPAGLGAFRRSRGGHLYDNPADNHILTMGIAETSACEFIALEQGGIIQNLGLMAAALGLGGFAHFAAHPFVWQQKLGFRMEDVKLSQTIGAGSIKTRLMDMLKSNPPIPTAVGLEVNGEVLLKPFCPPYYKNMEEAVLAFVDYKYAQWSGTHRGGGGGSAWQQNEDVRASFPRHSDKSIAATIAHCDYIYKRYGRFPAIGGPFRSLLAYQAHRLDPEFYQRFYTPEISGQVG